MNPRLAKEFRLLLLPWCVCAIAGFGYLAGTVSTGGVWSAPLTGLAAFALYSGCLLLATLPLGLEFQQRTLPLLLGQPIERARLWKEKFLAATAAVLALVVVHGVLATAAGQRLQSDDVLPCVGFIVATICSAGLFTLTARSVVGGMVFAGSCQFAVFALVSGAVYLCYKILGRDPVAPDMDTQPVVTAYVCAGALFSALTLWLGRRTFTRMEMRDAPASANLALPDWMTPKKLATILHCQPTGNLQNLVRKELGLQKPVFTIAVVLTACWIVTFLLLLVEPTRQTVYEGILHGLTAIDISLVVLIAACVSLGDEKTLGLSAWHLTLPVSARRQWLVKLLVAAATAVLAGLVLPLMLSCLTLVKTNVGLVAWVDGDISKMVAVLAVVWVVGVMGFWCASFWENTVRSALSTIVSLIGIGTLAQLGAWTAFETSSGFQTNLVNIDFVIRHEAIVPYSMALVVLLVTFVALIQSLAQFRRARSSNVIMLKYSLILAAVTFVGAFWCADLIKSIQVEEQIHLNLLPPQLPKHKP